MKGIDFSYGTWCDSLEKQANEQGYTLECADLYESLRKSIGLLLFQRIVTDKQADMMFEKLHKKVVKSLKLLEEK
jgi:hypothetical protein